jgi:hypothetical protein
MCGPSGRLFVCPWCGADLGAITPDIGHEKAHVRFGSCASVWPDHGDFRSTPVNGLSQDRRACLCDHRRVARCGWSVFARAGVAILVRVAETCQQPRQNRLSYILALSRWAAMGKASSSLLVNCPKAFLTYSILARPRGSAFSARSKEIRLRQQRCLEVASPRAMLA